MEKITFVLPFDPKRGEYCMEFRDIPKEFLQMLKDEKLLPQVLPDLFPDTFGCEIIIDPESFTTEADSYSVDFYLDIMATEEMCGEINAFHNRGIELGEDEEDKISFSFEIKKGSKYLEKDSKDEIFLSF